MRFIVEAVKSHRLLVGVANRLRARRLAGMAGRNGNGRKPPEDPPPLRSELFSVAQLEHHARSIAASHVVAPRRKLNRQDRLLPRLSENEVVLSQTYELIAEGVHRGRRITPAAEWFLDNYHLIEDQIRTARRHLPRGYSRELPQLLSGPSAGYPRVYDIALELISHVDGHVDGESVSAFVSAYQSVTPLLLGELWAVPIMLRLALLENLRRVAARIGVGRRDRERAMAWVERMHEVASEEPADVVIVLAEMVAERPALTTAFVAEFANQLQGQGASLVFPITWLEQRLAERGETLEHVFQEASQNQAADQVSVGNSINSLRFLGSTDWRDFVERMSVVEQTLRSDPSNVYPKMDFTSRDRYRHAIEQIARRSTLTEDQVAHRAIELARSCDAGQRNGHVGFYLIDRGRPMLERAARARATPRSYVCRVARKLSLPIYLVSIALITAAVTALLLFWSHRAGLGPGSLVALGVPLAVGASQFAIALVNWMSSMLVHPAILPRLEFGQGIPPESQTIVAVPTMITGPEEIDELLEALEIRYLANRDPSLHFALLSDFRDAEQEKMPEDDALLQRAQAGIEALNEKYRTLGSAESSADDPNAPELAHAPAGGSFFLFHRSRRWNEKENCWMGWERKRGKLEELNATLRGAKDRFQTIVGPIDRLSPVKYVITLDSDTQLPRDSARLLVGTMAHPLNSPRFDPKRGRVVEGYGILQPRIGITIPSANRSRFSRLFAGEPGIDPYTRAVSDAYQDLFDEGSFIGKGIYEIDAFDKSVGAKLPENRILSHDLLEGSYARSGLVSDVTLYEQYPSAYPVDVSRRYRWTRGDWQIAPWLLLAVPGVNGSRMHNPISALSRWKIFDNLRRSLVPAALLLAVFLAIFHPHAPRLLTLAIVGLVVVPSLLTALADLARLQRDLPFVEHARAVGRTLRRQFLQEAFLLAALPYDALIAIDAISRTACRVMVTGKKLLEWRTAHDAERSAQGRLGDFFQSMWILPATSLATLASAWFLKYPPPGAVLPFAAAWLISPAVAWFLSRPMKPQRARFSPEDTLFLQTLARRTWRFFETYVAQADNYLPPDNFQEDPPVGIAHRTSPTNIGLALLANITAADFGFIPAGVAVQRMGQTFATLDKLRRYRGHFYNWYSTRSLEPLRPLYVSTVDSGNLAGHLLTLATGLDEIGKQPIVPASIFPAFEASLQIVTETAGRQRSPDLFAAFRSSLHNPPRTLAATRLLLQRISKTAAEMERALPTQESSEQKWWIGAIFTQASQFLAELSLLAPWVEIPAPETPELQSGTMGDELRQLLFRLDKVPTLGDVARLEAEVGTHIDGLIARLGQGNGSLTFLQNLRAAVTQGAENAARRLTEMNALAVRAREFADIDYSFLYDDNRRLLSIGFDAGERRRDASFYDLLASEARLASYVAIAQSKLPQEHWFALGRLLTRSGGHTALLSWSGSLFEYLMPLLVMPTYENTLLDETYHAVVHRQIEYGRQRNTPWGISESGYFKTDAQLNYQYRAFGVPGLGFKRGLADDLVIAPYASVMSLMVDAKAACANLRRLMRDGQLGRHGFYEAVDYTPERLPPDRESVTVQSFMAHHEGMSFLALAYVLLDRPMQRRFLADPMLRATDLLLHERIPKSASIHPHPAEVSEARAPSGGEAQPNIRVYTTPNTPIPEVHLLSNGRYHVVVSVAGGGYSRWRDLAVTRWHEDATRDCWGTFCYLRDKESGEFWSVAHQPTLKRSPSYEAIFSQGRAEFRRRDDEIDTHVEISVSPEDDIELRRIRLTNRSNRVRTIELTSYAEVVLATPAADAAHPAFSNLFVQTQIIRSRQAILCTRRPRSAAEKPPWMLHLMTVQGTAVGTESYETGRAEFIGRGRTLANPQAMQRGALTDSQGSVLDPIVAIRSSVVIQPDETVQVNLVTGVTESREAAMALLEKYHDRRLADRVMELAWTHSQVVLRQLDAAEADTQLYSRLASSILYLNPSLRAAPSVIARNQRGQSGLWGYSISGDLPIVLLRIGDLRQVNLVRQLVGAHAYWRVKGLAVDLVIWNEDQTGYRQALQDSILAAIGSRAEMGLLDRPGGIFVRRVEQMSEEDKVLIQTVARVIISDTAGTLAEQVDRRARADAQVPRFAPARLRGGEVPTAVEVIKRDLAYFNGIGGFTQDGREYVITTTPESPTPAPWSNVIANPFFGTVVTETGSSYTWCENAQSYRLTPWYNDWISDYSGEAFYLRDEETGRFWSPSPAPARGAMPYTSRHGFGYSIFEYTEAGISTETCTYVATDAPVKFVVIKIQNRSGKTRRLSLTAFMELVLGERRAANMPHIVTEVDAKTGALTARNSYNAEFSERIAFLDCSEALRTVSGDRTEFLGRNGSAARPDAMFRSRLSGRVGAALDPCAAMQVMIDLPDGRDREIAFMIGSGRDLTDTRNLVNRFRGTEPARRALEQVWAYWNHSLGAIRVESPDNTVNFLANGWLLYQTLACRIWGRSGFYQSGGAYGFRDQLQDVVALTHAEPAILRAQLLRSASRQFREGDVQHWWHPPVGRGVRTRISDDYLWLPYAVCKYVSALGDTGVLDERINFLESRPLKPEEESYYDLPNRSEESATLYDHCVRAIKHGLQYGEHGLPLMGSGDWNDGMNLVGEHGKGESVWLAFFLYDVLQKFADIARNRNDQSFADLCAAEAARLRENIEAHAWDGQWYRRAYFDDGQPLGSASNPECRIDSIPQSWSVLSRAGSADRSRQALEQVTAQLVNRDLAVIQLFTPPFDTSPLNPGYVKGYVPGVRENGGQYTHAAIWAVMAFAESAAAALGASGTNAANPAGAGGAQNLIDSAWDLFDLINPIHHGDNDAAIRRYLVEPYVVAADVYTNPQHAGRGGWTWYTGSAGWMYRLITESLLGIRLEVNRLRITPLLPKVWQSLRVHYRYRETFYHIDIRRTASTQTGVSRVTFDGQEQGDKTVPLYDDRRDHQVVVEV